jgi:Prokaryotic N-terminal methylation motif
MRWRKKRCFTLLETVVAMALLSLLISFLLGFYSELESMHSELVKERRENFRLLYVQHRLKNVLSQATRRTRNEKALLDSRYLLFFMGKDGSSAFRDGGLVSQDVLGRLYLDNHGRFCLATWPEPSKWLQEGHQLEFSPVIREVLLENVESLAFEFYMPPDKSQDNAIETKMVSAGHEKTYPQLGEWQAEWPITHDTLPALVKVVVQQKAVEGKPRPAPEWFIIPINEFDKPVLYVK